MSFTTGLLFSTSRSPWSLILPICSSDAIGWRFHSPMRPRQILRPPAGGIDYVRQAHSITGDPNSPQAETMATLRFAGSGIRSWRRIVRLGLASQWRQALILRRTAAMNGMSVNPYAGALSVLRFGPVLRCDLIAESQRSSEIRFVGKADACERIVDCRQNASDRRIRNSQGF